MNDVLKDKPYFIKKDSFLDELYDIIDKEGGNPETYKILQITDWHVDFKYLEGTNKICREEICC